MAKKNQSYQVGTIVEWNWMGRKVYGSIVKIYTRPVSKFLREFEFKRNGSEENPAYLVESAAGSEVLKGHQELTLSRKKSL